METVTSGLGFAVSCVGSVLLAVGVPVALALLSGALAKRKGAD